MASRFDQAHAASLQCETCTRPTPEEVHADASTRGPRLARVFKFARTRRICWRIVPILWGNQVEHPPRLLLMRCLAGTARNLP